MKKILLSIGPLAALVLCGCEVKYKDNGMLVATKVIQAKPGTTSSSGCTDEFETRELIFGTFNPLGGGYTHGLVVENRLVPNDTGPGRGSANDFQNESADNGAGQVEGPAGGMPRQSDD